MGKTTTSCTLGTLLSQHRKSVLIISTDPAHNLSDAFSQSFSGSPLLVNGFDNLYCMEIEPTQMMNDMPDGNEAGGNSDLGGMQKMMKEIGNAIPGIYTRQNIHSHENTFNTYPLM